LNFALKSSGKKVKKIGAKMAKNSRENTKKRTSEKRGKSRNFSYAESSKIYCGDIAFRIGKTH